MKTAVRSAACLNHNVKAPVSGKSQQKPSSRFYVVNVWHANFLDLRQARRIAGAGERVSADESQDEIDRSASSDHASAKHSLRGPTAERRYSLPIQLDSGRPADHVR